MFYTTDGLKSVPTTTPLGTLLNTIFESIKYDLRDQLNSKAPEITIECRPEEVDDVKKVFRKAIRKCINNKNKECDPEDRRNGPSLKIKPYNKGIEIYIEEGLCCWMEDDHDSYFDSLGDSIAAGVEAVKQQFPDSETCIAMIYHIDVGQNYGYDVLWMEGDERKSASLLLNHAMKYDSFWDEISKEECGFEKLEKCIEELRTFISDENHSAFMAHVQDYNK